MVRQFNLEKAGGVALFGRVQGALAVARDLGMKEFGAMVSPRPKITSIEIQPGDILVLACDGLYDVASTKVGEAVGDMRDSTPEAIASSLVAGAINSGSTDNVSAVVAKF